MKIKSGGMGVQGYDRLGTGKKPGAPQAGKSEKSAGMPKDDVALSMEAKMIAQAGDLIKTSPDIRVDKVEPLKASIAEGRYNVDSLNTADKILREVLMEQKQTLG